MHQLLVDILHALASRYANHVHFFAGLENIFGIKICFVETNLFFLFYFILNRKKHNEGLRRLIWQKRHWMKNTKKKEKAKLQPKSAWRGKRPGMRAEGETRKQYKHKRKLFRVKFMEEESHHSAKLLTYVPGSLSSSFWLFLLCQNAWKLYSVTVAICAAIVQSHHVTFV